MVPNETAHSAYFSNQDTFYDGAIKGVGLMCQRSVVYYNNIHSKVTCAVGVSRCKYQFLMEEGCGVIKLLHRTAELDLIGTSSNQLTVRSG